MRQRSLYLVLCAALFAMLAWAQWRPPPLLEDLRNFGFDTFQRIDPPAYDPAAPVRIVAIDERSLAEMGQWPWPRSRLAELTEKLGGLGAAAIAFDVIFAEPDRTSLDTVVHAMPDGALKTDLLQRIGTEDTNDGQFAKALAAAPSILGATMQAHGAPQSWDAKAGFAVAGDSPNAFLPHFRSAALPLPILRDAAPGLGATNWLPDRDGVVRRVPLMTRMGDVLMPSLAIETLRIAQGASSFLLRGSNASGATSFGRATGLNAIRVGDVAIDTSANGSIRPRYTATNAQRFISAADLLAGRADAEAVRGRLVLVGTTAVGLGDVRATPLDAVVPGVEIHAQVLEQLLSGRVLSRPDWAPGLEFVLSLLLLGALLTMFPRVPPLFGALSAAFVITFLLCGAWVAFDRHAVLLDAMVPSLAIFIAYLGGASLLWQTEQRAKRQVRAAFGKFVAPAVVEKIAERPELLVLSGETRELSILFSDLRNFSTISERLDAHEVASFLNGYLTPMTDAILGLEGTVDKYIGDAIVAFWNAPLDVADHTRRAVQASLTMRTALAAFNEAQIALLARNPRAVQNVRMGIGLNVGPCSVGNMGSLQRFDYSALGDPVNVAARLEALTKSYGVDVLAAPAVQERVPDFAWIEIDEVKVKGRTATTKLFTLLGDADFARSAAFIDWREAHDAMLAAARDGRPAEAHQRATRLLADSPPHWHPLYESLAAKYEASSDEAAAEEASDAVDQLLRAE